MHSNMVAAVVLATLAAGNDTLVPALVELLGEGDVQLRRRALVVLRGIGPKAKAAETAVVKLLGRSDQEDLSALAALAEINPASPRLVGGLVKLLGGEDPDVRLAAAGTLGEMGVAAKAALPALRVAAKAEQGYRRATVLGAILAIAPGDKQALAGLVALARSGDEIARHVAWKALSRSGAAAVIEAARLGRPGSTAAALNALRKLGRDALPAVVAALKSPHLADRRLAVRALGDAGLWQVAGEAAGDLIAALKDSDPRVRAGAARVLMIIRPEPVSAVPHLLAVVRDPRPDVRVAALEALARLAGPDPAVVKATRAALADPYRAVRRAAARTLEDIQSR
jgi:HEAT repeat protein